MTDLLYARLQMAFSLGFHIIFAAIGIAMPVLMTMSELQWRRTGDRIWEQLTRQWAKGTAIFFAVGAVSGTALSFELGLLWPGFMEHAGAVIGFPFSLEGFAFFTEAIFLGLYLYGWEKLSPRAHLLCGVVVAASGAASAFFVITANAWMNTPAGFTYHPETGTFTDIDPIAAMFNPGWAPQVAHMLVAAYMATAFGVAGVHALALLRRPGHAFHRRALALAMVMAIPAALVQPLTGDWAAKVVARNQPVKLAAMEGQFQTERRAPLRIGGVPDERAGATRWALEAPGMLSFLAYGDFNAEVKGLLAFPRDQWPPVAVTHVAFQLMVGCGTLMALVAIWFAAAAWRRRGTPTGRRLLRAVVVCAPLGFAAIEFGWVVTEVGRQPWIIHGVMRTSEALTPMPGLVGPFLVFTALYTALGVVVARVMTLHVRAATTAAEADDGVA
ncbi:MAG: cytochrome ubiquinol oxidase subunit I [Planctomycetota bacterium]|nr:MAG: cytochrome ubiquinol oxidase subunit I [Planctomycetota bacterium]